MDKVLMLSEISSNFVSDKRGYNGSIKPTLDIFRLTLAACLCVKAFKTMKYCLVIPSIIRTSASGCQCYFQCLITEVCFKSPNIASKSIINLSISLYLINIQISEFIPTQSRQVCMYLGNYGLRRGCKQGPVVDVIKLFLVEFQKIQISP